MKKTLFIILVVIAVAAAVLVFKNKQATAPDNGYVNESPVVCTQDAKQCLDGSYVSRQGPNCEFAACPTPTKSADATSCKPYVCADGTQAPSCSETGVQINYIADPCLTHGGQVSGKVYNITFSNGTANPASLNIKVGDTVKFINNDTSSRWPASGPHPVHTICPGFDSLQGLKTGDTYSFTFNVAKTCPWHDHLKPAVNGKIEVTL